MRYYIGCLFVVGMLLSACGTNKEECKYKIGEQCVKAVEKEIFDVLTNHPYFNQEYISDDTSNIPYSKIKFSIDNMERITYIDGYKPFSKIFAWGIENNLVFIDLGDDIRRCEIKKGKKSIKFYDIDNEINCRIWDTVKDARKHDGCSMFGL